MKIIGPMRANNLLYLSPVTTMVTAYLVLSEGITLTACLGCALILIGIAATTADFRKKINNQSTVRNYCRDRQRYSIFCFSQTDITYIKILCKIILLSAQKKIKPVSHVNTNKAPV